MFGICFHLNPYIRHQVAQGVASAGDPAERTMDATTTSNTTILDREPPGIGELFGGFLWLGMIGFGGVLPLSRRMIVEDRRWLTGAEFTELLALCQFLPGGNVINVAVAIGLQ